MPRFQTSDDINIFYEVFGEDGPPIICIHPPLMGHVVFKYQRALGTNNRLILYDLRGHGHSSKQLEDHSIWRHTQDILELIDHLDIHKVTLLGYSAGGTLAMDFALRHRNRVQRLILSGGFPKVDTWTLKQQFNIGILLMENRKVEFLSEVLARSHKITETDRQELSSYGKKVNVEVVHDLYSNCLAYDCSDRLTELSGIPTLVLYGARSYHINRHRHFYMERLPSARVAYVNKATHQLPTRFHKPFNHAITKFLAET